jgi:hypothetical protein
MAQPPKYDLETLFFTLLAIIPLAITVIYLIAVLINFLTA